MPKKKYGVLPLFFPIFMELLFSMLTGAVDTLMLATEGDQAVGAVGTANTYIGLFLILFSIISSGMMAVMTQTEASPVAVPTIFGPIIFPSIC